MHKKFLLALSGLILVLANSTGLQAEEYRAGFDVGYRQTNWQCKLPDSNKYTIKQKNIKHILLKAYADVLLDNHIYASGELRYGFAIGKFRNKVTNADGVLYDPDGKLSDRKLKNKSNVFEGDATIGYQFVVTDNLSITPVVGYEFQKYNKKKQGSPFFNTAHSPVAGILFTLKPSDVFTIKAKAIYSFPKLEIDQDNVAGLKGKKRTHRLNTALVLTYAVDQDLDVDLEINCSHQRLKHKKFKGIKTSYKTNSLGATLGATYRF